MSAACVAIDVIPTAAYEHLSLTYDATRRVLWMFMHPTPRPCFTRTLLTEILDCQQRAVGQVRLEPGSIDYLVLASAVPGMFNLGGDLELFARCIRARNRDALFDYGCRCIDAVYQNAVVCADAGITTMALVQGPALGGGFEAALSANVLIAERGAAMGFPEILFNLFPGMGAYSLVARRVGPVWAERLLRSGQRYSAERLHRLGLVDVLAPAGQGVEALHTFVGGRRRTRNGHDALDRVRQRVFPLAYEELLDIVDIWADAALRLTSRDLRMMEKFAAAQSRLL